MKKQAGFTLIELLVVILIMGVLAVIALPQYQRTVDKSHATQMFVIGKAVKDAQELYYLTHGHYSTSWDELDIEIDDSKKSSVVFQECSSEFLQFALLYAQCVINLAGTAEFLLFAHALVTLLQSRNNGTHGVRRRHVGSVAFVEISTFYVEIAVIAQLCLVGCSRLCYQGESA